MATVFDRLGPHGPLAQSMPGYEHRIGQLQMAEAVEQALEQGQVLICEAGTGTGKTLAYLVPAICSGQKIVVSTATKALQDQIISQDIPALEQYLGLRPHLAVAKGLSNYLCRRRFEAFRESPHALDRRHRGSLARIESWVRQTETGDVAELEWLPEGDRTWLEVCSSAETRQGSKCPYFRECFVTRMRKRAEAARIVIANHHLVFADLAVRRHSDDHGGALPAYEAIVFDEAHQIEDIASDFFGIRVSTTRLEGLVRDAEKAFRTAGLSDTLLGGKRKKGATLPESARTAGRAFFESVVASVGARQDNAKQTMGRDIWCGETQDRYHRFDASLEALEAFASKPSSHDDVLAIGTRAHEIRRDLARIIDGQSGSVTWLETRQRSAAVGATPVDVGPFLRETVFERVHACVLTSATLSTSSGFSFFRSRIGLESDFITIREQIVPSPFDFSSHALLYTPTDLCDPNEPNFSQHVAERCAELIRLTDGGALVLCTSNRAMSVIYDKLSQSLSHPLLMQGQAPKINLLDRFKALGNAVLVATMSFWEGVDIAGHALRLVIIDKIPFAVPSDPIVMARCAELEQNGGKPFMDYQVPAAAITLKQGFGRLIRTQRDRGIVALMDRRISQRGYGKSLISSLPPAKRAMAFEQVVAFWQSHREV
ncbi:MAG TPA: ATP-dependent DNA helicase [Polyangiaceae bacterium]|nr:ATP-dependent DNA helicase [Polyangiaceae bacterium]HNZ25410.1 ATP-dependent DNA helicase [Polyangiaceae bacterium]HOD24995.1 ATP-dependent DNA helicase [Polyangiaceae bacterium]HOE51301.1 ATP-dependent DNA helicase [Polyangiaceae bacterium]HOH02107.1 ATP-dependent DNA helicase [Polyangiaceae bacterium]